MIPIRPLNNCFWLPQLPFLAKITPIFRRHDFVLAVMIPILDVMTKRAVFGRHDSVFASFDIVFTTFDINLPVLSSTLRNFYLLYVPSQFLAEST